MTAAAVIEARPGGGVRCRTGKVEIGQGLHTALAQIVADELGLELAQVEMLGVSTAHSPDQGVTSGSLSVQEAGAALRAACAQWRRSAAAVDDAAAAPRWVGRAVPNRRLPRLLGAEAAPQTAAFIHDFEPPGLTQPLLHGRVLHPPQTGAALLEHDPGPALALAGVVTVLRDGDLLGVVAASAGDADAAAAMLLRSARWATAHWPDEGADALPLLPASTRWVAERGAAPAAPSCSAVYTKPWIAHASIGPSCALAQWQQQADGDWTLQVWSHSQGVFNLRRDLALAFDVDTAAVQVDHVEGAGCYGHNGADDVAFDAAWLARAVAGRALRLLWSRADELSHAPFGPAMRVQLQARLNADGRIDDWQHTLWSPGHSRRPGRSASPALLGAWEVGVPAAVPDSIDMPPATGGGAERNAVPGYDIASVRVLAHRVATRRRSSALRALGAFANVFAIESFVDELAAAAGICPLALRRRHLQHDSRALAVLDAAAAAAGYEDRGAATNTADAAGASTGMGLALARYKGSGAWCAVVAQVQVGTTLQVQRLTVVADIGSVVNPEGAAQQLEGGAIQACSWTLKEQASPAHAGWDDYPILRFSEVPAVDVRMLPSTEPSLGAGEAALGPTAAAIANALFDALGLRIRDLPLTPERLLRAIHAG